MSLKAWAAAALIAVGTVATVGSAQAAPLGSVGAVKDAAIETSGIEAVSYGRRCWWHRGHYHCRHVGYHRPPVYGFYYGPRHHHWGHHHGPRRWH
jgi:hypothetical protein